MDEYSPLVLLDKTCIEQIHSYNESSHYFVTLNRDKERTKEVLNCFFIRTTRVINIEASLMSFEAKIKGKKVTGRTKMEKFACRT